MIYFTVKFSLYKWKNWFQNIRFIKKKLSFSLCCISAGHVWCEWLLSTVFFHLLLSADLSPLLPPCFLFYSTIHLLKPSKHIIYWFPLITFNVLYKYSILKAFFPYESRKLLVVFFNCEQQFLLSSVFPP